MLLIAPCMIMYGAIFLSSMYNNRENIVVFIGKELLALEFLLLTIYFCMKVLSGETPATMIYKERIINRLDNALLAIGAYQICSERFVKTPRIRVDRDAIVIDFDGDPAVRKKIESYSDQLSTALPKDMLINGMYFSKSQDELYIFYDDLNLDKRVVLENIEQVQALVKQRSYSQLMIDNKRTIDLEKNPGVLIVGESGSG